MDILFLWAAVGACLLIPHWINRRHHNKNAVEFRNYKRILTSDEINEAITSVTAQYRNSEKQYDYVYTTENMPLGRASAFLNYHGTNCWAAEPYLFLCKRSLKDNEFREYDFKKNQEIKNTPQTLSAVLFCICSEIISSTRWAARSFL